MPSAAQIATMNRLAGEVDRLHVSIAQTNKKIADLEARIAERVSAFHRATSDGVRRSAQNSVDQYRRQINECHKQNANYVAQIEQKRAEYNRLERL
ncbi:hypothetical protein QCD79_01670 [Pseudomonas quasicaspiana]|nr:hypothetical protein [Pseudomonas quasicaspiana]